MDEAVGPRLAERLKKRLFWLISRVAMGCYRRVPIFGRLRASIGVIRDGDRVLVIRRNDGRGLSFPGGLAHPWETDEQALVREIQEETPDWVELAEAQAGVLRSQKYVVEQLLEGRGRREAL